MQTSRAYTLDPERVDDKARNAHHQQKYKLCCMHPTINHEASRGYWKQRESSVPKIHMSAAAQESTSRAQTLDREIVYDESMTLTIRSGNTLHHRDQCDDDAERIRYSSAQV